MTKKEKHVIYLALCVSRVLFLFGDYILSNSNKIQNINTNELENNSNQIQKISNENKLKDQITYDLENIGIDEKNISDMEVSKFQQEDFDESDTFDEIQILKSIYTQTKKKEILNVLLKKLVNNYQFDEAKSYMFAINAGNYSDQIDPQTYLHILVNSISLTNPNEILDFDNRLKILYKNGNISQDDYNFYIGLIKIRNKNYDQASQIFNKLSNSTYDKFIKSYLSTLSQSPQKTDMPSYYKDGLISLAMLKNGYFSIAKKIALSISMQNEDYILPYQILAYSHFLTNDREPCIEYLFKLIDINPDKEENYKFLIGVSYYWAGKYEESVIYLSQIKGKIYQTDVYRYLILNYIASNDNTKLIRMRQSILGQDNLEKSDFYNFFYNVFFKPYKKQELFTIYNNNPQLSISFLDKCYQVFGSGNDDICIYGQVGQDIASSNRAGAKDKLLYLGERYPQSYIFHALGDYYFKQNDIQEAKKYYLKAISITSDEIEKNIIKNKLIDG